MMHLIQKQKKRLANNWSELSVPLALFYIIIFYHELWAGKKRMLLTYEGEH